MTEPHNHSPDEAIKRISSFEEMFNKYGVKVNWSGHKAALKGPVSGSVDVTSRDVTVVVTLGMMARAAGVKGDKLAASIRKRLRAALDE
ncbi:MAG: polyhydroxyalkanoic acid system family protein [Myxococcales bacterium]|nr:polyhydroxyalkanoic acid system family protein [Myxococcales bacterium]